MDTAVFYGGRDPGLDVTRFLTGTLNATNGHMGTFFRKDCVAFILGIFALVLLYCYPKATVQMWKPHITRGEEENKNKNKKMQLFQFGD